MCCQDQSIESCECGTAFTCSAEEQESPVSKSDTGVSEPGLPCRRARLLGLDLLKSFEHHS